jgi:putative heme-binding domain-containing protein
VLARELGPARLASLREHPAAAVRERAAPLLAAAALPARAEVVERYRRSLDLDGHPARGRETFRRVCSSCHRLEGVGNETGPSLAAMRARGVETVLLNVLDPNREVNPEYLGWTVLTRDGRAIAALIEGETAAALALRLADGVAETVPRAEVLSLRPSGLSFMPEGLESELDEQAMADLLAYVMTAP